VLLKGTWAPRLLSWWVPRIDRVPECYGTGNVSCNWKTISLATWTKKATWLQTDFQRQRSDSRDHGLHLPSSSVELLAEGVQKRCLVGVWHLSLGALIDEKPGTDWRNSEIYSIAQKQQQKPQRSCCSVWANLDVWIAGRGGFDESGWTLNARFIEYYFNIYLLIVLQVWWSPHKERKQRVWPFWRRCRVLALRSGDIQSRCQSLCELRRDSWWHCWFYWANWGELEAPRILEDTTTVR